MTTEEIRSEIERTILMEADAIAKLKDTLDENTVIALVKALADCKGKIIMSGCGTSAMAAKKAVHSLNCVERPALFLVPSDAVHGGLGTLQKDDILILVSKGGNTSELIPLANACKTKEAYLIVVSENSDSKLAKLSDMFVKVKVDREPCRFNMLATASTLAVISMFDAVCIAMMTYTNYTKEQFAIIHPNGAVGERLLKNS